MQMNKVFHLDLSWSWPLRDKINEMKTDANDPPAQKQKTLVLPATCKSLPKDDNIFKKVQIQSANG